MMRLIQMACPCCMKSVDLDMRTNGDSNSYDGLFVQPESRFRNTSSC